MLETNVSNSRILFHVGIYCYNIVRKFYYLNVGILCSSNVLLNDLHITRIEYLLANVFSRDKLFSRHLKKYIDDRKGNSAVEKQELWHS